MAIAGRGFLGKYENVKVEYPRSMADTEENYQGKPAWVKEYKYHD